MTRDWTIRWNSTGKMTSTLGWSGRHRVHGKLPGERRNGNEMVLYSIAGYMKAAEKIHAPVPLTSNKPVECNTRH